VRSRLSRLVSTGIRTTTLPSPRTTTSRPSATISPISTRPFLTVPLACASLKWRSGTVMPAIFPPSSASPGIRRSIVPFAAVGRARALERTAERALPRRPQPRVAREVAVPQAGIDPEPLRPGVDDAADAAAVEVGVDAERERRAAQEAEPRGREAKVFGEQQR